MRAIRSHLTYANVISSLCLVLILGGGAAYAADTIGSSDIINESIQSEDLKNSQVKAPRHRQQPGVSRPTSATTRCPNGGLGSADIAPSAVGTSEIAALSPSATTRSDSTR